MTPIPKIMVAPNGARRTKSDHPEIPETIEQTVAVARASHEAGAQALHAHVRDENLNHVLDTGLYRELIAEMAQQIPDMLVQVTTEAVGRYSASFQRQMVRDLTPSHISAGLRELISDGDLEEARRFYHWAQEAQVAIQHILYSDDDLQEFLQISKQHIIPPQSNENPYELLFVLGRYTEGQQSSPSDIDPFLKTLETSGLNAHWSVCAFGFHELDCLLSALRSGGKARVGFENSIWNRDGTLAKSNQDQVRKLVQEAGALAV